MLICGCGRWMHTEGVAERQENGEDLWLVRSECRSCRRPIGLEVTPQEARPFVDRLTWSDEAGHRLDRMPPYVQVLMKPEVEEYARSTEQHVITLAIFEQARRGGSVSWAPEAERRLGNVPPAVRAMARVELERTAMERGQDEVTVALMEEVKARYFGISGAR
jgi:proto-chlorophyllide reductase subunit